MTVGQREMMEEREQRSDKKEWKRWKEERNDRLRATSFSFPSCIFVSCFLHTSGIWINVMFVHLLAAARIQFAFNINVTILSSTQVEEGRV